MFRNVQDRGHSIGFAAGIVILLIHVYRRLIAPWIPPCCRFFPTCSRYGLDALKTHGFFKGTLLTAWRVVRCNPFCEGGYDPVPPKGYWKSPAKNRKDIVK